MSLTGWRRIRWIRWLKRRGIPAVFPWLGPSFGCASWFSDCRNTQVGDSRGASSSVVGDVDADVLAEVRCGGHGWCHKRADLGHSARQGSDNLVAASHFMSCHPSSRLSICPPPVRSAPGLSSFPSRSIPLPPLHSALGGGDVGDRSLSFGGGCVLTRPFCADASVARSCLPASSVSVGSSVSSIGSLHSAGSRRLPSHSAVSIRRSVRFHQGKCGNVPAQRGRGVAVASLSTPGVAPT